MAYLTIDDFRPGMSRTRKRVAGTPGQLWTLKDGHITRGGDIERRKKFVAQYELPAGSRGMASLRSQLYVFGSADLAATTPVGVQYQRLQSNHATGTLTINNGQNAGNTETVTIDGKVYTFQGSLTNVDGNVNIGADRIETLTNLARAINLQGGTPGTDYAAAMTRHPTVYAIDNGDGTITINARQGGDSGNAIATTETLTQGSFSNGGTLTDATTAGLVKILDVKSFQGFLYVIAEYDDGNIFHFYNGERVHDWDAAAADAVSIEAVAARLAAKLAGDADVTPLVSGAEITLTAREPGTAFTLATATSGGTIGDTTIQANVAEVAEVRATADIAITDGNFNPGTDTISSVTVDGVEILSNPVDWNASNAATAIRLAAEINNGTSIHGYSASVVSATVTITAAPGTGDSVNSDAVVVTTGGSVAVTADSTVSGGVDAVAAVAQVEKVTVSGAIEATDSFTVTVNGTDYKVTGLSSAMGTSLYVDKQRVWSTAGTLWRYCSLADATIWDPDNIEDGADAGFLDMAQETEGTDNLVGATRYQNFAAVMSETFVTLWALDTDPDNFALADTLDNTGTEARGSIVRYGNNDVFYLESSGVRSLRARDASNAPFISDVGNAIDSFVKERLAALNPQALLDAIGAIEPQDGRFWLAAGGTIFVLSFFPGTKVSAFSYYEPEEFDDEIVEAFARAQKRMYVRAGDTIFLYGGLSGNEYPETDEAPCVVELPFISANTPATFKEFFGFDIACENNWQVDVLYDPNNEERTIGIGTVVKTTFNELDINLSGQTTMIALNLTCNRGGPASISSIQLHYRKEEDRE